MEVVASLHPGHEGRAVHWAEVAEVEFQQLRQVDRSSALEMDRSSDYVAGHCLDPGLGVDGYLAVAYYLAGSGSHLGLEAGCPSRLALHPAPFRLARQWRDPSRRCLV